MADQVSNFKTIYTIISDADFTGLVKGSTAIKKFAEDTTASTKTVSDLTKVVDASVSGVSDYFATYNDGFASITDRFAKFSKDGASATGVIEVLGGTVADVLNVGLKQSAVGMEVVGKLLSVDLVAGAAAFAASTVAIGAALAAVSKGFSEAITQGVVYTRGLETTKMMLQSTADSAYTLSSSLVDSANKASWDRVGKAYSGYVGFFVGLGKAATAVKGSFSDMAASVMSFATPFSNAFQSAGDALGNFSELLAKSSGALSRLREELGDTRTNVKDVQQLNDQFTRIASGLGVADDVVRTYFENLKVQTRDANASLKILEITAQAALNSEFMRQNQGTIINTLTALKTGAAAPVDDLVRLGVAVEDASGMLANNAVIIDNYLKKLVDLGAISAKTAKEYAASLNTGTAEAAVYNQRLERLRQFGLSTLELQKDLAAKEVEALTGKNKPEELGAAKAKEYAVLQQYSKQQSEFLVQAEIDRNNRVATIRGGEVQNLANNSRLILLEYERRRKAAGDNAEAQRIISNELANQVIESYNKQQEAAKRTFEGQVSAAQTAINALKAAGSTVSGESTGKAQLALGDQRIEQVKAEYREANKGIEKEREGLQKVLQIRAENFAVVSAQRAELITQIEAGQQAVNQLIAQAGSTGLTDLENAKLAAKTRIDSINQELAAGKLSATQQIALLNERTAKETAIRDLAVSTYRTLGDRSSDITKQSISSLNTIRINSDRVIASIKAGADALNPSQALRSARAAGGSGAADRLAVALETAKFMKELEIPLNKLKSSLDSATNAQEVVIAQQEYNKTVQGRGASRDTISRGFGEDLVNKAADRIVAANANVKPTLTPDNQLKEYRDVLDKAAKERAEADKAWNERRAQMLQDAQALYDQQRTASKEYIKNLDDAQKIRDGALKEEHQRVLDTLKEAKNAVYEFVTQGTIAGKAVADGGAEAFAQLDKAGKSVAASLSNMTFKVKTEADTAGIISGIKSEVDPVLAKLDAIQKDIAASNKEEPRTPITGGEDASIAAAKADLEKSLALGVYLEELPGKLSSILTAFSKDSLGAFRSKDIDLNPPAPDMDKIDSDLAKLIPPNRGGR